MNEPTNLPLITFVIVAYKQEGFIADAVRGALSQTYSPLEIILSDDCSPDHTFDIVQSLTSGYQGPHSIILNRNEHNLGLIGHINRVMELAKGELIVVAAGDDISRPNRTEKIYNKYIESGRKALSIFSRKWEVIDEQGNFLFSDTCKLPSDRELDYRYWGVTRMFVPGHSHAWHRSIFDLYGPIDTDVISEDIVLPFRASLLGSVESINDTLVARRHHSANLGGPRTLQNSRDTTNWYRKRQISLINNRIGVAKTFLRDIETAERISPQLSHQVGELAERSRSYLIANQLEIKYINSNMVDRLLTIFVAVLKYKMPISRLGLWILGPYSYVILSSFPINSLYELYRSRRLKDLQQARA